jgi:hypothetical protein
MRGPVSFKMKPIGRYFCVIRGTERGEVKFGATPPDVSMSPTDTTSLEPVEIPLSSQGTSYIPLVQLWVENTVSLDRALELLRHVPRVHNLDISCTKQCGS